MDSIATDIKNIIEDVTIGTFKELSEIYQGESKNRLVFPYYSKEEQKTRISEQELRFVFIERLIPKLREKNLYYSIETPTLAKYKFSDRGNKNFPPRCDEKGQSASFDLVILKNNEDNRDSRVALIEFKSKNARKHEHEKDFCKLMNPDEGENALRYFIELLESANRGTIKRIKQKIDEYEFDGFKGKASPINIACYSLEINNSDSSGYWIDLDNEKLSKDLPCFYKK